MKNEISEYGFRSGCFTGCVRETACDEKRKFWFFNLPFWFSGFLIFLFCANRSRRQQEFHTCGGCLTKPNQRHKHVNEQRSIWSARCALRKKISFWFPVRIQYCWNSGVANWRRVFLVEIESIGFCATMSISSYFDRKTNSLIFYWRSSNLSLENEK